jgi:hypothetical protein
MIGNPSLKPGREMMDVLPGSGFHKTFHSLQLELGNTIAHHRD